MALMLLTADSPDKHRFISEYEREYILEETKALINPIVNDGDDLNLPPQTPWMLLFKSKSCLAIFFT